MNGVKGVKGLSYIVVYWRYFFSEKLSEKILHTIHTIHRGPNFDRKMVGFVRDSTDLEGKPHIFCSTERFCRS